MPSNQNLYEAARWYQSGLPDPSVMPRIDWEKLGDTWREIEAKRDAHRQQAEAHATALTGYTFDLMTFASPDALALCADCIAKQESG